MSDLGVSKLLEQGFVSHYQTVFKVQSLILGVECTKLKSSSTLNANKAPYHILLKKISKAFIIGLIM